jgi:hypothetical protein
MAELNRVIDLNRVTEVNRVAALTKPMCLQARDVAEPYLVPRVP